MTEHGYAAPAGIYGPVDRLGDRPRPRRPGVQPAGAGDLGRAARGRLPRRPQRPLRRDVGADHRRARARGRLRHRALHQPRRSSSARRPSRPSAPIGGAPPITSDPPFHALARRLLLPPFAPKQIEPWEPEIRKLCRERLDDMGDDRRRRDGRRRRPAVRPAHPGERDRPHARLPARGRRPVPRVRPRHAGGRQPRARGAPGQLREARRLHRRADRGPPRRAPRRPHVVPARRRARRAEAVATSTSAARSCCCCSPASTRRGAPSARACGTSRRIPTTVAGWSPSRS